MSISQDRRSQSGPAADTHAMTDVKRGRVDVQEVIGGNETDEVVATSTTMDSKTMSRLGMRQLFVRRFHSMSTMIFTLIANGTWIFALFLTTPGLVTGGRANLVWSFLWNFFGFLPVTLSLAEMASIAPTAGAQYHWVSEFAPARFQKILSYYTGWYSSLAFQAGNASGFLLSGTLVQTLILLGDDDYSFAQWQGALITIAICLFTLACNLTFTKSLSYLQTPMAIINLALYVCMIVAVWACAPKVEASAVFTGFVNSAGWSHLGLAVLAGQLSGIYGNLGIDIAVHMSEEVKDASRSVPIAMVGGYFVMFSLCFLSMITVAFGITNLNDALNDNTTYPSLWVLKQTMSLPVLKAWTSGVQILILCSNYNYLAAVSRDLFAFARDHGLPFSVWIAKVHRRSHIPHNALNLSAAIAVALSLIYIGSATAFYAISSLCVVSILQCYMFSIGSILWRRIYLPHTLPRGYWSLGRHGIWINATALIYTVWGFFWAFWPQTVPIDGESFNWASVMFVGVFIFATLMYVFKARHVYEGPMERVQGRRLGKDELQEESSS